jgi:hypothetical protein
MTFGGASPGKAAPDRGGAGLGSRPYGAEAGRRESPGRRMLSKPGPGATGAPGGVTAGGAAGTARSVRGRARLPPAAAADLVAGGATESRGDAAGGTGPGASLRSSISMASAGACCGFGRARGVRASNKATAPWIARDANSGQGKPLPPRKPPLRPIPASCRPSRFMVRCRLRAGRKGSFRREAQPVKRDVRLGRQTRFRRSLRGDRTRWSSFARSFRWRHAPRSRGRQTPIVPTCALGCHPIVGS